MASSGLNPSSGPSGRSPFPSSRNQRTRITRTQIDGITGDESSHSPLLQGLLRFSPNNSASVNHWSPRASTSNARGRTSFFGGTSFNNAAVDMEDAETSKNFTDESSSILSPPPKAAVDGIPLERLRSLANQSATESPSQAAFFASLLYAKTGHPSDALMLSQIQLNARNFSACLKTLEESCLLRSSYPWEALLVACSALAAQEEWPSLVELLEDACRLPDDLSNQNKHPTFSTLAISKPLDDNDDFAWHTLQEAMDQAGQPEYQIHLLARICTWRGRAYLETGHGIRAATYWKRALKIDCQCQAAWEYLLDRHLVTASDAYQLLDSLDFSGGKGTTLKWLKALYLARIEISPQEVTEELPAAAPASSDSMSLFSPNASAIPFSSPIPAFHTPAANDVGHPMKKTRDNIDARSIFGKGADFPSSSASSDIQEAVDGALDQLWNDFKLQHSPHVLAMAARRAYRRYQWKDVLNYAERLSQIDPLVPGAAFCYISTLVLMGHKRVLFRLAHEWVEFSPKSAQSWFAVGAYYYCCRRFHVAQRHFCRATRLDPQCTEAWVAFGCAFAACDESDQALASFRAAQRLSPGDHTSLLYMGMEYVRTNHLVLAQHFLHSALKSSGGDPLCLHELGVLYAQKGENESAIVWFQKALTSLTQSADPLTEGLDRIQDPYWEPALFDLGHCYRKTRQFEKAELCYHHCVALCPEKGSAYAALAFTKHLTRQLDEAIQLYHQALSFKADDAFSTEMLQRALQEQLEESSSISQIPKHTNDDSSFLMRSTPQRKTPKEEDGSAMMMSMDVDISDSGGSL
ncbi:anaphase-promoting complex subunit 6 [Fistulifera solaris]|uniref:Anaphase-promoting complex subunit 6 n=1 Tax=Fistulifera solaris TaxID=1519565 RepID=A0A1Z5J8H5_FISSO|nr:anaphase-promoting complex subunit 6 [Fistulifera solaris]|eukprot:GAX10285.1 anaphase-promoting complex subunit 6 [Fistulifera solaris]